MVNNPSGRLHHLLPLVSIQAVGLACGVLGVRWSSEFLAPEVLGVYGLLASTHTLAAFVTHRGMIQYLQRHWTAESSASLIGREILKAMPRPTVWLAVAAAAFIAGLHLATGLDRAWVWWGWIVMVNLLALAAHLAATALQAEERYWSQFTVSAVGSVTRSFVPLLAVLWHGAAIGSLGAGFALHTALWFLAGVLALAPAWRRGSARNPAGGLASAIISFLGVGILGWVAQSAPRWFAAFNLPPQENGYFMLAANLSVIVPASIAIVGTGYAAPWIFAAARAGETSERLRRRTDRNVCAAVLLGQAALIALTAAAPGLIGRVIAPGYAPAVGWLLAAGGGFLATVSASFYCDLLSALGREKDCARLVAYSTAARVAVLCAVTFSGDAAWFRLSLTILAWPTLALEWWLVRRWLRTPCSRARPA